MHKGAKIFLLASVAWSCSTLAGWSRLGESKAECNTRYGEAIEVREAQIPGSDPEALIFEKEKFRILVEFKSDVAWSVHYSQSGFHVSYVTELLQNNRGESDWEPASEYLGSKHYMLKDESRVAIFYRMGSYGILHVTTDFCRDALEEKRKATMTAARDLQALDPIMPQTVPGLTVKEQKEEVQEIKETKQLKGL